MRRKVVQHGNKTLTLSLPSKWVKSNKIQKGQFLDLELTERGIIINPKKTKFNKIEIDISNEEEWYISRILTHLYTYGFEEIKIDYSDKKVVSLIRKCLNDLSGFEIVENGKNFCIIKSLTFSEETEFNNTMKRIFWQILSQYDSFLEDAKRGDYLNYEESLEVNKVIIRLINLSKRLVNKNSIFDRITSKYVYNLNISLLNISRSLIYSYEKARTSKSVFSNKELELMEKIKNLYQTLNSAYLSQDLEKVKTFLSEREAIIEKSLEILKEKNPIIMHFFLDMFKEFSSISNYIIICNFHKRELF